MTITGMAKQLNVSTMTIYRRCKKNGVNVDDLRDDASGELSAAGVAVIASMFDATTPQTGITGDATQIQRGCDGDTQQPDATTAAVLRAKLDGMTALVEQLQSERDELRRKLDAVTAALEREQNDRAAERLLLSGNVEERRRVGLFGWLRRKS